MRRTLLLSCVVPVALLVIACSGNTNRAQTTKITSAPLMPERELPRTLRSTAARIAQEVCQHESRCGHGGDVSSCVNATAPKAREQLRRWNCEPAAIRARLEECLAGLDEQVSCDANLKTRRGPLCPPNVACGDVSEEMIPVGPALSKIWE